MINRLYFFIAFFIFYGCTVKKSVLDKILTNYYQRTEDSLTQKLTTLNLTSFSDSVKWNLYCIYGNDSSSWGLDNKNLPNVPLAFLNLKLLSFSGPADTINLFYRFIYQDSFEVESYGKDRKPIASEVMVNLQKREIIGYGVDFLYTMDSEDGKFRKPFRPEIISFIKNNKDKLDPWFKEEAQKRGLF
jgi:hypothetical protein